MSFVSPVIQIGYDQIFEEGEEEYTQNLAKTMEKLPAGGIKDGTVVTVEDFEQDLEVQLVFAHVEFDEEEDQFVVGGEVKAKAKSEAVAGETAAAATADDGDDIMVMNEAEASAEASKQTATSAKRKRADENTEPVHKKGKAAVDDEDIVFLD